MKKIIRALCLTVAAVTLSLCFTGCFALGGGKSARNKQYAGKYVHDWSIMLMYGSGKGDGHDRDWWLELNENGTGTYYDGLECRIEWEVDGDGNFKMKDTGIISLGREFTGTFEGSGNLHFYDGPLSDSTTVEYMFKKAN